MEVSTADGYGGTDTATAFATVSNTVPTITTAQLSPTTNVTTSSLLTCSASATDTNDGTLSVSYAWSASGGSSSSGATWQLTPSAVGPGETITCTASATDNNGLLSVLAQYRFHLTTVLQPYRLCQFLRIVE